jgi:NADH dehydrogenase
MTSATTDQLLATAVPSPNLHRVVVVGGGAGGLELVTRLGDTLGRRGRADIALVERARTHLWKPLLHEVAAGSMDVSRHELDYLAQAFWHGFRFRLGEMVARPRAALGAPLGQYRRRAVSSRRCARSGMTRW